MAESPLKVKKKKMSNSVVFSAMTIIALTGITLTTLKYQSGNNDHSNVELDLADDDDYYTDTMNATRLNPKFHYYDVLEKNRSTEKSVIVKRSNGDGSHLIEYSIEEKNVSMIDETRREKVKQVQAVHGSMMISNFLAHSLSIKFFRRSLPDTDDDTRLEQLQALCMGQE